MKWHENNPQWRELQFQKVSPIPHWFKNWRPDNLLDQNTIKLKNKQRALAKHLKAKIACHLPMDRDTIKDFETPYIKNHEYSEEPVVSGKFHAGALPPYQKTMELGERLMKPDGPKTVSRLDFRKGLLDLFMEARERYPRAGTTSSESYAMNVLALRNEPLNERLEYKPNRILPTLKCEYKVGCLPLGLLLFSSPQLRDRVYTFYKKKFSESFRATSPDDTDELMKRLIDTFETPVKSDRLVTRSLSLSELDEGDAVNSGRSRKLVDRAVGVKKRKLL